jgi:hypothetical protein
MSARGSAIGTHERSLTGGSARDPFDVLDTDRHVRCAESLELPTEVPSETGVVQGRVRTREEQTRIPLGSWTICHSLTGTRSITPPKTFGCTRTGLPLVPGIVSVSSIRPSMDSSVENGSPQPQGSGDRVTESLIS